MSLNFDTALNDADAITDFNQRIAAYKKVAERLMKEYANHEHFDSWMGKLIMHTTWASNEVKNHKQTAALCRYGLGLPKVRYGHRLTFGLRLCTAYMGMGEYFLAKGHAAETVCWVKETVGEQHMDFAKACGYMA
jgi:hypothetical protein